MRQRHGITNEGERRGVSPPVLHPGAGLRAKSVDYNLPQNLLHSQTRRTGGLTPRRSPDSGHRLLAGGMVRPISRINTCISAHTSRFLSGERNR